MTSRARSFGSVASAYERYRPGYPERLVERVCEYAARPVRTALEIGAGTGKATRVFAAAGIAVTATDPDPAMLTELRRHDLAAVVTVQAALEDLAGAVPGRPFDLVFAAAAMHWTDPAGRWERVAGLLDDEGVFASFGGQMFLADDDVEAAVRAARAPYLVDDGIPSPDATPLDADLQWPGTELARSALFDDVEQSTFERRITVSAEAYIGHLSTISAYLELAPADRADAFAAIRDVLPERVVLNADLTLHLARRSG